MKKTLFALIGISFVTIAATLPFESIVPNQESNPQSNESPSAKIKTPTQPRVSFDQQPSIGFTSAPKAQVRDDVPRAPGRASSGSVSTGFKMPRIPSIPQFGMKRSTAKLTQKKSPDAIARMQREVEKVIELNDGINESTRKSVGQIQNMIDKSRVHRRILGEKRGLRPRTRLKVSDAKSLLMQEKIRALRAKTDENLKVIQDIKNVNEALAEAKEEQEKEAEAKSDQEEKQ